ncbi:MAG: flagellar biosynthetic protein FliO [Vulcanimicrobiota bacterium]
MLLIFSLASPVLAQENPPEAPAQVEVVSTPQAEEASPPAPEQKPRTVGEALSPQPATSGDEVPTASELNFPEKREIGKDWATEGRVGKSTFVDKLIEVCWSLALICLLLWAISKVAGRFGVKNLVPGGTSDSQIEILEKKRLSPGRTVILMRVGPKVLAVAATESGYKTLTEFELEDFQKHCDNKVSKLPVESQTSVAEGGVTPGDIARHYLSIIPGTGAKK